MNIVQKTSIALIVILVVNIYLQVTGRISELYFWAIIIVSALFSYFIKRLKNEAN